MYLMKNALIIYGGWDGHTPKETGYLFKEMLEAEGFDVTITDTLDALNNYDDITKYKTRTHSCFYFRQRV